MELSDYVRLLLKRAWIIALAVIVFAAGALVLSRLQTPVYRSTIFLNVWPGRLDWGLQQTIKGIMRNYAGIIRSRQTAEEVVLRLGLDMSPDTLREDMKVSSIESDFLIQIDVDHADPLVARDIAQTTAEAFVERINAKMLDQDKRDRVEVGIRDYALPGGLHRPKWKIYGLAGAMLGLLFGVLVSFAIEWLEAETIRADDDIEKDIGVPVLGVVPVSSGESDPGRAKRRALGSILSHF